MQFQHPSELAKENVGSVMFQKKYNFPFAECPLGMSFKVESDKVSSLATLRATASREGAKLGRKFVVIDHGHCYEVYYQTDRPAMPPKERKKPGPKPKPVETQHPAFMQASEQATGGESVPVGNQPMGDLNNE